MFRLTAHALLVFLAALAVVPPLAAAQQDPATPASITVLSYNIHHGEGTDGKVDLERIAQVIRESGADVIALQEVDVNVSRSGNQDQAQQLATLLEMHVAFGANLRLETGEYGNAVLSRWPIKNVLNRPLPNLDEGEPRGLLTVEIEHPFRSFRVWATHLDHRQSSNSRLASIQVISKWLTDSPLEPTLMAGDFNASFDSPELDQIRQRWTLPSNESFPTVPVDQPSRQIDFVVARPSHGWSAGRVTVLPESIASDHLPIRTRWELNSQGYPGTRSDWNGFPRYDFKVDGFNVTVVAPQQAAAGRPWVWHGEFFGHKPAPDIALLEKGFHCVAVQFSDQLGSPEAVEVWSQVYEYLHDQLGLAEKVGLVGLSRGGLYCYHWALSNPDRVAAIYGDAPVVDFRSWPGGLGKGPGSPVDWERVMRLWNFSSVEEAQAYEGLAIDHLDLLAAAGVPLLHVFGDADEVVPWDENTGVIAERYPALGGHIELIRKPGVKHHPHGLDDPTPIVDFLLKHCSPPTADQGPLQVRSVEASSEQQKMMSEHRDSSAELTIDPLDSNRFIGAEVTLQQFEVRSPYQSAATALTVLTPTSLINDWPLSAIESAATRKRLPVIVLLPVEANHEQQWGNALQAALASRIVQQLQAIVVIPTFSELPWYADHPTLENRAQERYMLDSVMEFVRWRYPEARHDAAGRWLIGFSKSGWGAWSLALRHPDRFHGAVAFDAPLMMSEPGLYGSGPIFETTDNFQQYQLRKLVAQEPSSTAPLPFLIHIAGPNFKSEHDAMNELLTATQIKSRYVPESAAPHAWDSRWLEQAIQEIQAAESERR